jgi:hypothetical protein
MSNDTKIIQDTYWVEPDRLMAGEYPGAKDDEEARCKLRWLLSQGIDYWLDLTEAGEGGLKPYAHLLAEEAAKLGRQVEHRRFPIPDLGTLSREEMRCLLDTLQAALDAGRRVYVHCWGGIGRTGTVVGCYLRQCGLSGEKALRQIADLRAGTPDGWRRSPETAAQTRMVEEWSGGGTTSLPTAQNSK